MYTSRPDERRAYRAVFAATVGAALDAFDVAIYGFMAVTISKLFFPSESPALSLLLAFGSYGISLVMRPLGAAILGSYADRCGRKAALSLSLSLMGVGSLAIGVMPTYESIGVLAPIGVMVARLLQGFAIGGEQASAATFLAEQHPQRRGEFTSFLTSAAGLTVVLAAGVLTLLTSTLDTAQIEGWGWRLPFLFGALIYPFAVYIRRRMSETTEFVGGSKTQTPVRDVVTQQGGDVALAALVYASGPILVYLIMFMPSYAATQLQLSGSETYFPSTVAGITIALASPLFGKLSDRIGRFNVLFPAAVATFVVSWPAFALLTAYASWQSFIAVQLVFAILAAAYNAAILAVLAELFPVATRTAAIAIAGAVATMVFGSFAPFFLTSLVAITGNNTAPSLYVMLGAALSGAALLILRQRRRIG